MMQSQLAAALLGHGNNAGATAADNDDDKDVVEPDEEADDVDEFIDEEFDVESGARSGKAGAQGAGSTGRTVTLQMLLSAKILQPGEGTMSIEYLGQRFIGDLLPDGKIKSQETDIVFASPSAWAIHCKRIINPEKKSGCGWASVKYRGRKLDAYKNVWFKKKKQEEQQDKLEEPIEHDMEHEINDSKLMAAPPPVHRVVMKHSSVSNRTFTHDSNTLIECVPFSSMGKMQPFNVQINTNALLMIEFHCHLTTSEICGYLTGTWDVNGHTLHVTRAFPCRNTKADRESAPQVEAEIHKTIDQQGLTLVGWYHSHPTFPAAPTLRDVDAQLEYQIKMKGSSDSSYSPCIGIICSPYNQELNSLEAAVVCYWVVPPPETKPNEYGRPMVMTYNITKDSVLPSAAMEEMKKCVDYYKKEKTFVDFSKKYHGHTTYLEKLKTSLSSKFPRDQNDSVFWGFIKEVIGYTGEDNTTENTTLLAVPSVPMKIPTSLPSLSTASSLSSNLMLNSNLANVLFQSGKFPSATSILGLPDPMAQSTLAANNMFLSPTLFKMQDTLNLLKPLSMSTPLGSSSKSDKHKKHELKTPILDFSSDFNALKKMEYSIPDLTLPKTSYSSDLTLSGLRKMDYSASDLSISSSKTPKLSDSFSIHSSEGVTPPKVPKTSDFGMLDLSVGTHKSHDISESQLDLSINKDISTNSDQPLNLAE